MNIGGLGMGNIASDVELLQIAHIGDEDYVITYIIELRHHHVIKGDIVMQTRDVETILRTITKELNDIANLT